MGRATAPSSPAPAQAASTSTTIAQSTQSTQANGCVTPKRPSMNMSSPDAALGQMIGREAGTALAGDAPLTVDAAEVQTLGNQVPPGAKVDACADRITFSKPAVTLVIEAVPKTNPDMTFRIAGLVNPTVVVPRNAQVSMEYINADSDEAHALVITRTQPPFAFRPAVQPAFPGSAAGPIGDPTTAGHGARDLTFKATASGTYQYLCPMPGHAQMGMHGTFVVR